MGMAGRVLFAALLVLATGMGVPNPVDVVEDVVEDVVDSSKDPVCTGAKEPKHAVPFCYTGKASVLGGAFSEAVTLTVKEYAHDKGKMDLHATGAEAKDCKGTNFTKTGQKLNFDVSDCFGAVGVEATWCSDQDQLLLHVSVPHFPVARLPVLLKHAKCP